MKRTYIILAVLSLCTISACEHEIRLPVEPDGGRLYIESFPSNGQDTTYIRLMTALPVTAPETSRKLEDVVMTFSVNGESFAPELFAEDGSIYTYIVNAVLEKGNKVEVAVSANGFPSVSSVSNVPEGADLEMSREIFNYGTLRHKFTVKRDDTSGEKRYYGISVTGQKFMETTYTDSQLMPKVEVSYLLYDYEMSSPVTSPEEDMFGFKTIKQCQINGCSMAIFEDDGGKTRSLEVTIDIPYEKDGYRSVSIDHRTFRRTIYRVKIFSLTKDAYEYLNPKRNSSLIGTGLIPPFISSDNISGGYGITSCIGCTDLGWLDNLE